MDRKVALVTGGARRIGRAIALALAHDGFDIALHYQSSESAAQEVAKEIRDLGARCELLQASFGEKFDAHQFMQEAARRLSGPSVLVNNVSMFQPGSFLETDELLFDRTFQVNLRTPFFLTKAFAVVSGSGLVVNILDTRVAQNRTDYFAYSLSKKALREFTKMAAVALAPRIRVNAVCPGLILPPPGEDEAYLERRAQSIPAKAHGSPEDIARAILFLVHNPFVTGEEIFVDGGEHLL